MNTKMRFDISRLPKDSSSFRDDAGFVFYQNNDAFRYISPLYYNYYNKLKTSRLYDELVSKGYLVPSEEVEEIATESGLSLIIKPKQIPFISYPYEWSFSQLKDAAILTLSIQKIALKYGMELKDASAYNIQFIGSKPIFIDTLSFEPKNQNILWKAYKQYCQHFLGPLTILAYSDPRLKSLMLSNLDGIPLDMVKRLIPKRSLLSPSRFLHIWAHESFQNKAYLLKPQKINKKDRDLTKSALALVESLYCGIKRLKRKQENSVWKNYYRGDSYQKVSFSEKNKIIKSWVNELKPPVLWDLGSNDGHFTEAISTFCKYCVAFDFDLTCIENMYTRLRKSKNESILPLHADLVNPSPGIGWANKERKCLFERGRCDVALALALIHHLLVTASIPLHNIVSFFKNICKHLIIEFVPPKDPKFQQICETNPKDYSFFTEDYFLKKFSMQFDLVKKTNIPSSSRILFHFKAKQGEKLC